MTQSLFIVGEVWEKNEAEWTGKADTRQKEVCQQAQHAKLYSDQLQT